MWDLSGPGLEPVSPALAGRFLTTAPLGKSLPVIFWCERLTFEQRPKGREGGKQPVFTVVCKALNYLVPTYPSKFLSYFSLLAHNIPVILASLLFLEHSSLQHATFALVFPSACNSFWDGHLTNSHLWSLHFLKRPLWTLFNTASCLVPQPSMPNPFYTALLFLFLIAFITV